MKHGSSLSLLLGLMEDQRLSQAMPWENTMRRCQLILSTNSMVLSLNVHSHEVLQGLGNRQQGRGRDTDSSCVGDYRSCRVTILSFFSISCNYHLPFPLLRPKILEKTLNIHFFSTLLLIFLEISQLGAPRVAQLVKH